MNFFYMCRKLEHKTYNFLDIISQNKVVFQTASI